MRLATLLTFILVFFTGASAQAQNNCKSEYTDFDLCSFSKDLADQMAANLPMRINKNMSIESINAIGRILQLNAVLTVNRKQLKETYDKAGKTFDDFRQMMTRSVDSFCVGENPVGSFIKLGGIVKYTVSVRPSHLVRCSRRPVVGQQLVDGFVLLRRQAGQHILQIGIEIMPVQLGGLDQGHHRSRPLATA